MLGSSVLYIGAVVRDSTGTVSSAIPAFAATALKLTRSDEMGVDASPPSLAYPRPGPVSIRWPLAVPEPSPVDHGPKEMGGTRRVKRLLIASYASGLNGAVRVESPS